MYLGPDGAVVRDPDDLSRIRALAIPPAWKEVWICPVDNGHLQATGRDSKGRKQYRYHSHWRQTRDEAKYSKVMAFGRSLPAIRRRVRRDLRLPGLPREKVLATVVRLLESTLIRVGNIEYARENGSFGLTTMRRRHVRVRGSSLAFQFRGKSGRFHRISIEDRRLAKIVKRCRDIPGHELFQYLDEQSEPKTIDSSDVNEYLREITGQDFTAKDFRTWAGTLSAATALQKTSAFASEREAKRNIVQVIEAVAQELGNTPAICRKCYIHPAILDAYLEGVTLMRHNRSTGSGNDRSATPISGLRSAEAALLSLLRLQARRAPIGADSSHPKALRAA